MKFVVVRLGTTVAAGQLDLWNKIIKRARRLGGVEIDFVCEHCPSGRKLTSLVWHAARDDVDFPGSDAPTWQFRYAVPRGKDVEARICAAGRTPPAAGLAWLNELSELLVALCDNWPVAEAATIVVEEAPAGPVVSADEPRILTAPWTSAGADGISAETPRRALRGDAA